MGSRFKEIYAYRDMIGSLVQRELRGKYKGSVLGFLWTFINPLCQIIVYTIVFSIIVRSDLDKFYVYIITGMIPWLFFDSSMRIGAGCVRYQGDMIKKIYFPREVLPIACVTANFVNMLFCFVIVFLVLFVSGVGVSLRALFSLPLVMLIEYILVLGFTLLISSITVFFKDLEHIVTVVLMAWIYLTPILYSISSVPGKLVWIFKLNPLTYVIEAYHSILYWQEVPTATIIFRAAFCAAAILIVGEMVFAKLDDYFAEEL
ncbi:MAG: ABC transporter permease [Lachnospiraceae bacterium]|nr:ABC transporter permease [Lachnospiraceae bacterium]